MMPHPQIRTVTRNRTRTRRYSSCNRHPSEPVTGFCALCLRDRLAGLDSSSAQLESENASSPAPELRRSKSVAGDKHKLVNDLNVDPRRNSCDVRVRNTLSDLFVVDDTKKSRDRVAKVESMNLGFSNIAEEDKDDDSEIRVSDDVIVGNEIDDDDEVIEGDLKTMKEIIEMELQNRRRNLRETASVFSQKLRKWRQKQKEKKQNRRINVGIENNRSKLGQFSQFGDNQSEVADYGIGRRSCDTEPRFSIDAHRLSVEDPRFSLEEHRASWDGYVIARTIPRLTPMLSVVDNMMLAPVHRATNMDSLQIHSIREDGASSGGSAQSNSDSSSSNRGSSSSSMKSSSTKTGGFGGEDVKSASNARVSPASDVVFQGTKLVITEKELKDWRLNSTRNNIVESDSNATNLTSKKSSTNPSNELKKKVMVSRWRKVCNLWGHKQKLDEKNSLELEHAPVSRVEIRNISAKLVGNPSCINSRTTRDEFVLDRKRNTRYSTSDIDSGLLRLYLTPFRNSRRNKCAKSRFPSMGSNSLQLQ